MGGSRGDPGGHWGIWRAPDPGRGAGAGMVWPCLRVFWFGGDNPTGRGGGEGEKEADRRRGGGAVSEGGRGWTLPARLGQLKAGQDGKGLLQIHMWCPDDLPRLWDRIE